MADDAWKKRKLREQFPRTDALPSQSSKFWAKEKDRYLRQLLISDIEEITGRELIVYYAQLAFTVIAVFIVVNLVRGGNW